MVFYLNYWPVLLTTSVTFLIQKHNATHTCGGQTSKLFLSCCHKIESVAKGGVVECLLLTSSSRSRVDASNWYISHGLQCIVEGLTTKNIISSCLLLYCGLYSISIEVACDILYPTDSCNWRV